MQMRIKNAFRLTVGIPVYLNGYAAIPLVADLIENGVVPGASRAFMLASE